MPYAFNRRDTVEAEIVRELFARGAYVALMQREDGWDITVFYDGEIFVAEIKTGNGKLTENERTRQFHIEQAGCKFYIWRSPQDAIFDVFGDRA